MIGSIRIFEKKNFIPKPRIFVLLKVKIPDLTDWHSNFLLADLYYCKVLLGLHLYTHIYYLQEGYSNIQSKFSSD